jgi:PAS domain S-box-containing protein
MTSGSDPRLIRRLKLFSSLAAVLPVGIGLSVLIGRALDITALFTWGTAQATAPNAAASLALAGVSLWLRRKPDNQSSVPKAVAKATAAIAGLVGLLSLAEHLFVLDLGIDRWLVITSPALHSAAARILMSPIAAGTFVLLGLALVGIDWRTRQGSWPAQYLCLGAMAGAAFGFLGTILEPNVSPLGMALPAAAGLFTLASGLLCSRAEWVSGGLLASQNLGARLFRKATPAALLILSLIGFSLSRPLIADAHITWVQACVLAIFCSALLAGFIAWMAFMAERGMTAVIASAMDAIITTDEHHRILLFNAAAEKMFRCPAAQALGQPLARFIPSPGATAAGKALWAVRADGEKFQIESSVSKIETAGKALFSVILRDVTERKQTEEVRDRLAAVVDWSDDAIISKTLDGTITAWNRGAEKIFGYTSAEAVGKPMQILMPLDRVEEETDILARISRGESLEHFETLRVRKDGSVIHVSVTISPMKDSAGAIVGASKVARDITERKLREDELRESEERFRLFVEHAPADLAMFDRHMRYLHVSRRWRTDYALGNRDLLGVSHYEIFPQISERWKEAYRRGLAGEVLRGENDRFEQDVCGVQWIRWEIRPWLDRKGEIGGIVLFTEDMTERNRAQESLREQEHLLSESQRIAHLGSWTYALADPAGRMTWSEELYRLCGVSPNAFTPTTDSFLNLIVAEDRVPMQTWFAACARGDKPGDLEFRIVLPGGSIRYLNGRGELQSDAENRPIQMAGSAQDITDRRHGEDALRDSEERFQALANGIPQLAWMAEADGSIFWYNQRWYQYTGTTLEQMLGWAWQTVHDPALLPAVLERWQGAIATGQPFDMDVLLRGADGIFRAFLTRVMPLMNPEGRVVRWFGTNTDISERKEAEQELARQTLELASSRENLEKQTRMFRLVLDSMGEGLIAADAQGQFLIWNDAAKKLMGRDAVDIPTKEWTPHYQVYLPDGITAYPPENLPLVRALRGESVECELIIHHPEIEHPEIQQHVFLEIAARPMRDAQGNLCGGVAVLRDVTSRKQVEAVLAGQAEELSKQAAELLRSRKELETQQLMLQSVLDSMSEGLVAADEQGKFILWNPAAEKIVGLGPADMSSQEWSAHYGMFMPDEVTPFPVEQNPLLRALKGEVCTAEMFLRHLQPGTGAWIESSASPLRDKSGVLRGGVVAFRDITQRKTDERKIGRLNDELEEKVLQRTAQLQAANHELEAFAYSVSHDLRAPLRHIAGFAGRLQEEYGATLDSQAQHYVQRMQDGAQRMGQLVDELLNLAQIGRRALRPQLTGLNSMVEDVVCMLQPETNGREVEWKIGSLPSMKCDAVLIRQVFQNLISNAIKYSRTRSRAVIEIGHTYENGQPVIFIRDNGVGFNMKYADKLFGVFHRLHRAEDFEGIGVGLATVLRIVQKHGGRVWAEAELDRGATFYFTVEEIERPRSVLAASMHASSSV